MQNLEAYQDAEAQQAFRELVDIGLAIEREGRFYAHPDLVVLSEGIEPSDGEYTMEVCLRPPVVN